MRFKDELQRQIYYRSQIDYSYWMIQEISRHNGKMQFPLAAMIDKATGFDKVKILERIDQVKYLVIVIIRCKKKLNYEVDEDKKFLKQLQKLEKETSNKHITNFEN